MKRNAIFPRARAAAATTSALLSVLLAACGGGNSGNPNAVSYDSKVPFQVGTTTQDPELPSEPTLPADTQVCATLEASPRLVKRPDGALPPESDPSPSGNRVAADPATSNPDQARIQAALDACGAAVEAEVGAAIASADAQAVADQQAAAVPGRNIAGASGEELAKPKYRASKYAVRLVVNASGVGDAFISGPLTLPSGVTLWIDKGVTLFASRDVMLYNGGSSNIYCGNTQILKSGAVVAGSSGNCKPLIGGSNLVNSAVVGDGAIDSRAYAEIITTNAFYPVMKVDMTCSNTYAAFATTPPTYAPDGTPCDNGGTVVSAKSTKHNMTWWDLAYLGNMVQNGTTGGASQSNFRMMVFDYAKNLTLYRVTLNNSANFHVVPSGVDGLTVWGVKVQTPSRAAFANPAGNGNPLYTGETFNADNVKNTDAFDPASAASPTVVKLTTGSSTKSAGAIAFDGYLKNVLFAYNYISTGDDDIAIKGSRNPSPPNTGFLGVDGNRDVRSDRRHGFVIAHNHIYWGHGISVGSESNSGVANVHVYDNSFDGAEEALRIKSDYARGGEVYNVYYDNICARKTQNALLFTSYYSTKDLGGKAPVVPKFHDIHVNNMLIEDDSKLRFEGFAANTGGFDIPAYPLGMTLTNVFAKTPEKMSVLAANAQLKLKGVNLPLLPNSQTKVEIDGQATLAVDPSKAIDCSRAYVDFPSTTSPWGGSW